MSTEQTARTTAAGVLWTAVVALGGIGTILDEPVVRFWAVVLALGACMVTCHLIVECAIRNERLRIEYLIDGMVCQARADLQREREDEMAQRRR